MANPAGEEIAGIEKVPAQLRGDKVYWLPFFAVASLDSFTDAVQKAGGNLRHTTTTSMGAIGLVTDPQSGNFGVLESSNTPGQGTGKFKYRTAIAVTVLALSVLLNQQWVWGVAMLAWLYPDIRSGTTFLAEPLDRRLNPFWYWLVIGMWVLVALLMILWGVG